VPGTRPGASFMVSVDKIMSRQVVSVEMDDSLGDVRKIFEHVRFHHILVLDNGRLAGVLSDRDLLKAVSPYADTQAERPRDAATLRKKVHQIMSRKPVTIDAAGGVLEAIRLLIDRKISCLPVLDKDGSVAGVLTWRDILQAIAATVEKNRAG
jgi:acetoin utilization protein AcuB